MAFLQRRGVFTAIVILAAAAVFILFHWGVPRESIIGWLLDAFGLVFMFAAGLILIAQFSLPVENFDERLQAVSRIFDYAFGNHGPVVFVKDGKLIANKAELRRGGAGVILVDLSSAVVLERGLKFSRACGPGIVFMRRGERILATLDLRQQARTMPVTALTKDGIEVKTTVSVTFGLAAGSTGDEAAGEVEAVVGRVKRPYPFNPRSAFLAVYGGAVEGEKQKTWTELPAIVASEAFRNLLARQTLDDLFRPTDPTTFPMQDFNRRLTEDVRESPLLVERGIQVFNVSAGAFELPREVEKQRILSWEAAWRKRANVTLAAGTVEAEKIKQRARLAAQAEVSAALDSSLASIPGLPPSELRQRIAAVLVESLHAFASSRDRKISGSEVMRLTASLRPLIEAPLDELDRLIEDGGLAGLIEPAEIAEAVLTDEKPPAESPGEGGAPSAPSNER